MDELPGSGSGLPVSTDPAQRRDQFLCLPSDAAANAWFMGTYEVISGTRTAQPAAVCVATLPVGELPAWLGRAFSTVAGFLAAHGTHPVGPPFARYRQLGGGRFEVAAGFPVPTSIEGAGDVQALVLPGGAAASTVHVGPYDAMVPGYQAVAAWVTEHGGDVVGDPWEVYLSDPAAQPDPSTWRTEIIQPYRDRVPARTTG